MAQIDEPILGFDYIIQYKLDLQWAKGKCRLVDNILNQSMPLKLDVVNKNNLGLALVTFRQYSQCKSEANSKLGPKNTISPEYQAILDKFPAVLK